MKTGFTSARNFIAIVSLFVLAFSANAQNVFIKTTLQTGCPPLHVQFSDSLAGGFVPTDYWWSFGDGDYATGADSIAHTYFNSGTFTVVLHALDSMNQTIDSTTVLITVLAAPVINADVFPANCAVCDGSVDLTITGNDHPYTYVWSTVDTSQDLTGLCAGSYSVTVTGSNGCTKGDVFSIYETGTNCSDADGCTIDTCFGGVCANPPVSCDDSDACTTDGCVGGSCIHTPIVCNDSDPCTNDVCVNGNCVYNPASIFIHITRRPATPGTCDGTVDISAGWPVPPYTYQWTPSLGCQANCTGLCDGVDYELIVTDTSGCTLTDTISGGSDVYFEASVDSGCAPLTVQFSDSIRNGSFIPGAYFWDFSDGSYANGSDPSHTFNTPGAYDVIMMVWDTINSVEDSFIVTINVYSAGCPNLCDSLDCDDSDLCTTDTCSGGACFNVPMNCNDMDACTTGDTCILGACNYTPINCDDADGCTNDYCSNGQCENTLFSVHVTRRPATFGNCDGTVDLYPVGGTPPYTYQWNPSLGCTANCTGLCDGAEYTLLVTDSNGCAVIDTISGGSQVGIQASVTSGCAPLQVYFSDSIKPGFNAMEWWWSLGAVSPDTVHIFTTPGVYEVMLFVTDVNYVYDSAFVTITVTAPCYETTASAVDASCPGTCDGEASVSTTGGTPPFTYLWSNGGATQTITSLCAGVYHVTVSDSSGNLGIDTVFVGSPSLNASTTSASCNGICNGWASAAITGGTGPYGYLWSNAATTQTITSLCAGTYTVTVTDSSSGCVMSHSVAVVNAGTFTTSISGSSVRCDTSMCNAFGYIWASTGLPPPQNNTFLWSNGSTDQWQNGLCMGTYYVTSTSMQGCSKVDTLVIGFIPPDQVALNLVDTLLCPGDTVTIVATTGPFMSYFWSNVVTDSLTSSIDVWDSIGSAWWTVTAIDTGGCYSYDSAYVDFDPACVWPGDANYDGIANNLDVLAIGTAYSAAGPVRSNASLVWDDQAAGFWADTFITGVNYKHADCNGDGVVDYNDTSAVSLNYGFTHAKGGRCAAAPPLFVDLPDTLVAGQTLSAPIVLGDTEDFVDGLYGVAFTIYYDIGIVDSNSVSVSFSPSWMGTEGVDMLGFYKNNPASGQTDVAITRIDHTDLPQSYGPIGSIHFTIKDDVSGKKAGIPLVFVIDNVTAGSSDESEVFVCGEADSTVATVLTGVEGIAQARVQVYPNPAKDRIFVESDKVIRRVTLTDLAGKTVTGTDLNDIRTALNVEALPEGTYLLRLELESSTQIRKIVIH